MSDHRPEPVKLSELINRFEVFFIDQFGVLHDGRTPYPGAIDALRQIKAHGRRIVLVSNSGKRAAVNAARIKTLGFDDDLYDVFLTSGEVAWQQLRHELIGNLIPANGGCLLLARDDDTSAIDGLELQLVNSAGDADVILLSGCRDDLTLTDYDRLLREGLARSVPCLCTNPDKKMLVDGGIKFGSGEIAQRYADQGGRVTWIGKPYPTIYRAALAALDEPSPANVVCLGDSIEHDIAGGQNAGLSAALVLTGIAAAFDDTQLDQQYQTFDAVPEFLLSTFVGDAP